MNNRYCHFTFVQGEKKGSRVAVSDLNAIAGVLRSIIGACEGASGRF